MTTTNLTSDEREPYSEECRAAIDELEHRFESEGVELCSIEFVHQRETNAATRMRDKCVEKVRAMRAAWEKKRDELKADDELVGWMALEGDMRVADEIIKTLESLTLDQVEQETK